MTPEQQEALNKLAQAIITQTIPTEELLNSCFKILKGDRQETKSSISWGAKVDDVIAEVVVKNGKMTLMLRSTLNP